LSHGLGLASWTYEAAFHLIASGLGFALWILWAAILCILQWIFRSLWTLSLASLWAVLAFWILWTFLGLSSRPCPSCVWLGRPVCLVFRVLCLSAIAPERWTFGRPVLVRAMEPMTAADKRRAAYRNPEGIVPTRVVRKSMLDARNKLLEDFAAWMLLEHGFLLGPILTAKPLDPEEVCKWLVAYGQQMFLSGRAYGRYAETINAVATARPALNKHLSMAWDLAFAWLQHHPALPSSVLLAGLPSLGMAFGCVDAGNDMEWTA